MTETGSRSAEGPPSSSGHMDALDGMRAVAAFAVLVFHVAIESATALQDNYFAALLSRGDVAVPIFFTLSGLLLYRPYARAVLDGTRPPGTRTYLVKRALRILPAYWLVVVAAMLLWSRDHLGDVKTWLQMVFLAQNYETHPWWYGLGPKGLAQMWSLCVEAAYYLVLPLIAAGLAAYARRGGGDLAHRAKRLLIGLAALAAISYLWTVLSYYPEYRPYLNTWLPRSLTFFASGMALAVVSVWARRDQDGPAGRFVRSVNASPGTLWVVAGLAYAVAASPVTGTRFSGVDGVWSGLFELVLYAMIAACLVAPCAMLSRGDAPVGRLLGNPVMRYFGRISYGVFLWQFVTLYLWYELTEQRPFSGNFLVNLVVVGALTIGAAALTYRYVEEPARRLIRFLGPSASETAPSVSETAPSASETTSSVSETASSGPGTASPSESAPEPGSPRESPSRPEPVSTAPGQPVSARPPEPLPQGRTP
ncbi:acyltransferase family protein [Sphaerisporangium corydalis]|uniref:Acyltransferase family protein n=1 Tax=Sphaerisporangium corydalis TaxID=1441875 RepID=A0ABV9EDI0_9ACTN|nr:acyltransferase family protein [Sphaerisporangium corydalis]